MGLIRCVVPGGRWVKSRVPGKVDENGKPGKDVSKFTVFDGDTYRFKYSGVGSDGRVCTFWADVPRRAVSLGKRAFSSIDGCPVDFDKTIKGNKLGFAGVVSMDDSALVHCTASDKSEYLIPCRDVFNCMAADIESKELGLGAEALSEIYRSCLEDYPDEDAYTRTMRLLQFGVSPVVDREAYDARRESRAEELRRIESFQSESGYHGYNNTVLRADMIRREPVTINNIECFEVSVPTVNHFYEDNLGATASFRKVYIPREYFTNLQPNQFKSSVIRPEFGRNEADWSGEDRAAYGVYKKELAVETFDRSVIDMYTLCAIPDGGVLYASDGSPSPMTTRSFSALMTCLTSCQLCHDNLLCDPERFRTMMARVMDNPAGGGVYSRLEIMRKVPAVDYTPSDDGFVNPTFDKLAEVRRKMDAFERSRHSGDFDLANSHSGRDRFRSIFNASLRSFDVKPDHDALSDDTDKLTRMQEAAAQEESTPGEVARSQDVNVEDKSVQEFVGADVVHTVTTSEGELEEVTSPVTHVFANGDGTVQVHAESDDFGPSAPEPAPVVPAPAPETQTFSFGGEDESLEDESFEDESLEDESFENEELEFAGFGGGGRDMRDLEMEAEDIERRGGGDEFYECDDGF